MRCRNDNEPRSFHAGFLFSLFGLVTLAVNPALADVPVVWQLDIADYRAYLTDDHPVRQGMRRFAELADTGSDGMLRVRVRSDAPPGPPQKQIAALQEGGVDVPVMMLVATTGLATIAPEFELMDLPYLIRDEQQADVLLDSAFGDALLDRIGRAGLVGLAWWENGFRQITTSGAPIRRADDLKGLKLRVVPGPVFEETFRALGADPVPLPFRELRPALAAQRVAAQDNFYTQILADRLYEVQSSLSVTRHSYGAMVLAMNTRTWNALPAEQRRVLRVAALEAGRFQRAAMREEDRRARTIMAARGLVINAIEPSEQERLRAATQPLRDRTFGRHGQDLRQLYEDEIRRAWVPAQ